MIMQQQERAARAAVNASVAPDGTRPGTTRELVDSLLLFGLTATSLGAYVGIAFAAVRLLGTK